MTTARQTPQLEKWCGDFGQEYTRRNSHTPEQVDDLWQNNYGITRRKLNRRFLAGIPRSSPILEVGCNIGNQLLLLKELGYTNLHGVDVQRGALNVARSKASDVSFIQASAFALPYRDQCFELVHTSGVLIHISPEDIPAALDEIHRCSKAYIWGSEYYAPVATEVDYRGHGDLLWKMDYAREYLARFRDLEIVAEQRLPYLQNDNVDSMFLLRRTTHG